MDVISSRPRATVEIEQWPSEMVLTVFVTLAAIGLWFLFIVSIIGIVYAVFLGAFFFLGHVAAVAHIRGSAVRLGRDQMPDLYARVEELAETFGMERTPEAYLMQAGGVLNAFATRFLLSDILVLYAELLEACGDNPAARDMIVAHELGHLREGHLRWFWLRAPGMFVPFLGSALSRAREYTCDRYGLAGAGSRDGALLGLTVLASGGKRAAQVNRQRFVQQQEALNTGWMRIGEWMGSHPPLSRRLAALEPSLAVGAQPLTAGTLRALGILAAAFVGLFGGVFAFAKFSGLAKEMERATQQAQEQTNEGLPGRSARVRADLVELGTLAQRRFAATGALPSADTLWAMWAAAHPGEPPIMDMYGEGRYAYFVSGPHFLLVSVGPDGRAGTRDDIRLEANVVANQRAGKGRAR